jgi:hypothetical protein
MLTTNQAHAELALCAHSQQPEVLIPAGAIDNRIH